MRRMANVIPWLTGLCGVIIYLLILPLAAVERKHQVQLVALPPEVMRVVSLQFKEIASDIAFLNAMTYIGGIRTQADTQRYLPEQYEWVHKTLKNSVALDPYFSDPYYLMNSFLIWDRYKAGEVNELIAKGADIRVLDFQLPFLAGFNYYYFLNNGEKSFFYLKEASKRSDNNPFFASLAARVAYKANKTEMAILYLEEQISQAKIVGTDNVIERLKKRLEVLKGIRKIEVAVEAYRKLYSKLPGSINELVSLKLLDSIPKEPNGGSYYLDPNGRVKSTKDLQ